MRHCSAQKDEKRLYSVLDTVVLSGEDVCCSVVFGTLVGGLCLVVCGLSC